MKQNFKLLIVAFFAFVLFHSCSDDSTVMRQNITGRANEILVVIAEDSWEGKPGELMRNTLGQPQIGLPQQEPVFGLINVAPSAFKKIFKTTRNIIQVRISSTISTPEVLMKDNAWAFPQATVEIKAKDAEQFEQLFNENSNKILSYFISAEKKRLAATYEKSYEKIIYNVLNNEFGLTMKVPPGFVVAKKDTDFIWYKYETPDISQGIILYSFPYKSDSTFTVNYLVALNDSVLRKNIPGPLAGSYMSIEKRLDQFFTITEHNKNYASEMRGLWRLENDYMGGPYISLAELDASNQRIVVAFGYVYAPSKDKRNFLQQVEAMIYTLKFKNQAENDKINSQVKMGN
ncbi:MAG TPA: DUF4837 family protein [Draconibacterium sp.]|nr:DUF4837 family protein [Draconibacterium sp.]